MGRPAIKRKAESGIDTSKLAAKQMKTLGTARLRVFEESYDEDETGLLVHSLAVPLDRAKSSTNTRKSEPVRFNNEYDEDIGRLENQHFMDLVKSHSKTQEAAKKNKVQTFISEVEIEASKLKVLSEDEASRSLTRRAKFLQAFQATYDSIRIGKNIQHSSDMYDSRANNLLQRKSNIVVKRGFQLIDNFSDSNGQLGPTESLLSADEKWATEIKKMAQILKIGKEAGEEQVLGLVTTRSKVTKEIDTLAIDLFYERSDNAPEESTWADIKKIQEKVVKELTKALPRN